MYLVSLSITKGQSMAENKSKIDLVLYKFSCLLSCLWLRTKGRIYPVAGCPIILYGFQHVPVRATDVDAFKAFENNLKDCAPNAPHLLNVCPGHLTQRRLR